MNVYLTFDGRCAEAFAEYARIFGGTVVFSQTFGETPMAEHVPPEQHGRVMHAELKVGEQGRHGLGRAAASGTPRRAGSRCRWASRRSRRGGASSTRWPRAGTVKMALQETFWAKGFGMVIDRFGTPWIVNCGRKG